MDQTSAIEQQLTSEISSGSRVNSLSDDPVAVGENVLLRSQLKLDDSFSQTESSTVGMLQVTDSTLGGVVSQLTKALSLATEGNNGTLNASDLQSIATQLSGIGMKCSHWRTRRTEPVYFFRQPGRDGAVYAGLLSDAKHCHLQRRPVTSLSQHRTDRRSRRIVPGSQIFSGPTNNVLQTLNNLVADFSSGTASATAISDSTGLNSALNYVSQQRVIIDNSITQLQASQSYVQTQGTQITSAQTNLMQADVAQVSTQLSTAETQQAALTQVVNILEKNNGDLFSLL